MVLLPGKFINISASAIPIIMIGPLYGSKALGYYFLIDRIFAPITILISESLSRILESDFSKYSNTSKSNFKKSIQTVIACSLIVLSIIVLSPFSESFLKFIFGNQWNGIGDYFLALCPMYAIQA